MLAEITQELRKKYVVAILVNFRNSVNFWLCKRQVYFHVLLKQSTNSKSVQVMAKVSNRIIYTDCWRTERSIHQHLSTCDVMWTGSTLTPVWQLFFLIVTINITSPIGNVAFDRTDRWVKQKLRRGIKFVRLSRNFKFWTVVSLANRFFFAGSVSLIESAMIAPVVQSPTVASLSPRHASFQCII